jgi:AcrR family transcriptional regulator
MISRVLSKMCTVTTSPYGGMLTMSTPKGDGYHHGSLRQALVETAVAMLERGEAFSLRAVARETGVSQAAPYRHCPDRSHLESAVAAVGFRDLGDDLLSDRELPRSAGDLPDFAVRYVEFALRRPRMFRLMFGTGCDRSSDERVRASGRIHDALAQSLSAVYPDLTEQELADLATGLWATAHGLACLYSDGKLPVGSPGEVAERVHAVFATVVPPDGR